MIFLIVVLTGWIVWLELRLKRFFGSGKGENFEKVLAGLIADLKELREKEDVLEKRTEQLETQIKKCIQKTAVVRFNPFSDTGGDQSFSIAALDDEKNGFVISSLYGREINRVYAKPVKNGGSEYQLTGEEKKAIEKVI